MHMVEKKRRMHGMTFIPYDATGYYLWLLIIVKDLKYFQMATPFEMNYDEYAADKLDF